MVEEIDLRIADMMAESRETLLKINPELHSNSALLAISATYARTDAIMQILKSTSARLTAIEVELTRPERDLIDIEGLKSGLREGLANP